MHYSDLDRPGFEKRWGGLRLSLVSSCFCLVFMYLCRYESVRVVVEMKCSAACKIRAADELNP